MKRMLVILGLSALLATACKIESNIVFDIEETGAGTVRVEFGFDEEAEQLFQQFSPDEELSLDSLDEFSTNLEGAVAREEQRGDMRFLIAERPFTDVADLESILRQSGDDQFDALDVVIEADRAEVTARIDAGEVAGEDVPFDLSGFAEDTFGVHLNISMPGTVVDHDADRTLDDGTLQWDIPLTGGVLNVYAASEFGGGGFPWLVILIVLVALAAAAVVGVVLARRRSTPATALADVPAPAPPGEFTRPADPFTAPAPPETPPAGDPASGFEPEAPGAPPAEFGTEPAETPQPDSVDPSRPAGSVPPFDPAAPPTSIEPETAEPDEDPHA